MKKVSLIILTLLTAITCTVSQNKNLHLVFIGNSITDGNYLNNRDNDAPPARATEHLKELLQTQNITFSNQGKSGNTTLDFLPISETYFPKVVKAGKEAKINTQLIFSIMLGTNDSAQKGPNGSPVSPQQYYTNMKAIIDELLTTFPSAIVFIHRPIWYSPNTQNGAIYLKKGQERLNSYLPMIERLVTNYERINPGHVYIGDTGSYAYFEANYLNTFVHEEGEAGTFFLHPDKKGADILGKYWAEAIYKIIK